MNTKRILSVIIVLLMLFSVFSMNIFAVDADNYAENVEYISTPDEGSATVDEEPDRLLGDVNEDGEVNVKDSTLIRKVLADLSTIDEISAIYADVDRNEAVNIKDATIIQKYIAGMNIKESVGWPFDANPDTYRYYFYMPKEWLNEYTAKTGNTAGIYWWEGTNSHRGWQGSPARKTDIEGVYYYDVPKDVCTVIWNNYVDGGYDNTKPEYYKSAQTTNIGTEYYDPGESEFYPEGTDSFDGMIYVIDSSRYYGPSGEVDLKMTYYGEWFYYYGDGEYGTSPEKGGSKVLTGDTVDLDALSKNNEYTETYRYYFYMPVEWLNESTEKTGNAAGIYWWEGTDAQAFYPGLKACETDVDGVYYYDVPADVKSLIWNNYFNGGEDIMTPYYADAIMTREVFLDGYGYEKSELFPEGFASFDDMIFVTDFADYDYNEYSGRLQFGGEWFYYYGNGEYGTTPIRGESEIYMQDALNNLHIAIR